jgi:hypothetical protein
MMISLWPRCTVSFSSFIHIFFLAFAHCWSTLVSQQRCKQYIIWNVLVCIFSRISALRKILLWPMWFSYSPLLVNMVFSHFCWYKSLWYKLCIVLVAELVSGLLFLSPPSYLVPCLTLVSFLSSGFLFGRLAPVCPIYSSHHLLV